MILVSNKGKIFTERQDEILDIVNNGVLNYAFINILNISFSDFFGVDEIEQIFILKHTDCFQCTRMLWHGLLKIIGKLPSMMIQISF